MEATKGNGLTRRAFPRRGKGRGREGRMRSRRQQRGRGPLGTIGSPVNQGINMLDTSPPRGNAFVTPGNIFLPLASSPRPLSLFLLCSLYPSPRAPPPPPSIRRDPAIFPFFSAAFVRPCSTTRGWPLRSGPNALANLVKRMPGN